MRVCLCTLFIFYTFQLIRAEEQPIELMDQNQIEDLIRSIPNVSNSLDLSLKNDERCKNPSTEQEITSFENYIPCDPEIAQASAVRYAYERVGLPINDKELRVALHEEKLTIVGKIFGSSINSNYHSSKLLIDTKVAGRISVAFGTRPSNRYAPIAMNSPYGSCQVENSQEIHDRIEATFEKLRTINQAQYNRWKSFCASFNEYEEKARFARENNWKNEDRTLYQGCPPDLPWKRIMHSSLCSQTSQEQGKPLLNPAYTEAFPNMALPKSFDFFFDGFGDFNANRALLDGAVNVSGKEGANPLTGQENANGLRMFYEGVRRDLMANKSTSINDNMLFYYDGSGFKNSHNATSALACYKDMQQWLEIAKEILPEIQKPKTIVMGYSNGGDMALDFQHMLGNTGGTVDLLITNDPIPNGPGYFTRHILPGDGLKNRHPNTKKYLNFYQDSNYGLLNDQIDLTAKAQSSADLNIHLSPEDWGMQDGYAAHVYMLQSPQMRQRATCEIGNLVSDSFELCTNLN